MSDAVSDPRTVSDAVRIRLNIEKMRKMGAPKEDIAAYIAEEDVGTRAQGQADVAEARDADGNAVSTRVGMTGKAALQGATFGWSDELIGAGRAAVEGRPYADTVAEEREGLDDFRRAAPRRALGAEVVGGLATAIPTAGAGAPVVAGSLSRVARVLGTGAAAGGVSGAGTADSGAGNTVKGAALGAALGAATAGGLTVGGKVLRRTADMIPGIRPTGREASVARGVVAPANPIGPAVGEVRRIAVRSTGERADDKIVQNLQRDSKTVNALQEEFNRRMGRGVKPETIVELGGENTGNLMRTAHTVPGRGRDVIAKSLNDRAAGAETRVIDDILETTQSKGRVNVRKAIHDLADERGKEAEKLYGAVYDVPVEDPALGRFFELPAFKRAYKRARSMEAAESASSGGRGRPTLPNLDKIVDPKTGALTKPLTVRQVDRIKRGLDDVLDHGGRSPLNAGGIGNEEMATLRAAKNAFLADVDTAVPGYSEARKAFGGKSEMIKALDEGRTLWSQPIEEMEGRLGEMSQAGRDAFTKGAVEALSQKVESFRPGLDINRRIADSTMNKRRLRLLFPDDASFEMALERLQREGAMHATRLRTTGGSQTADKLMGVVDLFSPTDIPTSASGAMRSVMSWAGRNVRDRNSEQLSSDIADRLTSGADGGVQRVRERLAALRVAEERAAKEARRGRVVQQASGNISGQRNRP